MSSNMENVLPVYGFVRKPNSGGGGGTSDYNGLKNKPKINGVELSGEKA